MFFLAEGRGCFPFVCFFVCSFFCLVFFLFFWGGVFVWLEENKHMLLLFYCFCVVVWPSEGKLKRHFGELDWGMGVPGVECAVRGAKERMLEPPSCSKRHRFNWLV